MNWTGAKNSVYKRVTLLMLQRIKHDGEEGQKPVSR